MGFNVRGHDMEKWSTNTGKISMDRMKLSVDLGFNF